MQEITFANLLVVCTFLAGACISLIIYIYNNLVKRISEVEKTQKDCPINKVYTILETVRTDVIWIKQSIQKKN